jgi:Zn-dependent carboxypeptidase
MNKLVEEILKKYKRIWALKYASGLLGWDIETYMPPKGANARGEVFAHLDLIQKQEILSLASFVEEAEKIENLDDLEKGIIRVLNREIRFYKKVPEEIIVKLNKVTSEGTIYWRIDRKKDEFNSFKPYLQRIIEINKIIAEKLGYEKHPYNALLDLYEEGLNVEDMNSIFNVITHKLPILLEKDLPSSHELEHLKYNEDEMKKVNEEVLKLLNMPFDRFRMDISTHPFTIGISVDDVRITTRYEGIDFKRSLYSTIHECGHAIYNLNIDKNLEGTPVGIGASSGIHESQSRFWENIIGRSKEFVELIYHILKNLRFEKNYTISDFYIYFNLVKPSLIRVDADELTYNFHIALRFEIEKRIINDEIEMDEIPSLWNELMEKYLKIRPKGYADGFLQDMHWSKGWFGYFPTYTLGNVIAGIIWKSFKNLKNKVQSGDLESIKEFLKDKIHKYGAIYAPKDLLKRSFNETYNAEYLVEYLFEKYNLI